MLKRNCCDGIYNSFDIHFTKYCDNDCKHCIDKKYNAKEAKKPNVNAIVKTIVDNQQGYDDVLFLGGEPCLFLEELLNCIVQIKQKTNLKVFVTTAMPKTCLQQYDLFLEILSLIDGLNISAQHHNEDVADKIRNVKRSYDRQKFYSELPYKEKIRINLNIVKPFLYKKQDLINCLSHYDKMGFNSIKLSEIQHGKDYFISFESIFGIKLKSPFAHGCQTYINMSEIINGFKTPLLLKRSCFLCEETLKASLTDGVKVLYKSVVKPKNKYAVIYEDGSLTNRWI